MVTASTCNDTPGLGAEMSGKTLHGRAIQGRALVETLWMWDIEMRPIGYFKKMCDLA